jgi:adenine-specific DNA-methyltransferase
LHKSAPRQTDFARSMRRQPTGAEEQLWRLLRDRQLVGHKFRRQVPIGPFIADFACYSARLVVELDGSQHADDPGDKKRDAWFAADGYRIIRVWNNELTHNREGVLQAIWHALTEPAPSERTTTPITTEPLLSTPTGTTSTLRAVNQRSKNHDRP